MSLIRGLAGFLVFLLAFGLRREHAALWWYGLALGMSGVGALVGLILVARIRRFLIEQQILLGAIWLIGLAAIGAAIWGTLLAQVVLATVVGVAGSMAQPSFDAMTQRYIPVVISFPFPAGDAVMAAVAGVGGLFYVTSRSALRHRALPHQRPGRTA